MEPAVARGEYVRPMSACSAALTRDRHAARLRAAADRCHRGLSFRPGPRDGGVAERDPVVHAAAVVEDRFGGVAGVEQRADGVGCGRALGAVAEEDRRVRSGRARRGGQGSGRAVMPRAPGIVASRWKCGWRVSIRGRPCSMWSMSSSSPIVRTPGASSIGCTVPQPGSTWTSPSPQGRGTMQALVRRGTRWSFVACGTARLPAARSRLLQDHVELLQLAAERRRRPGRRARRPRDR